MIFIGDIHGNTQSLVYQIELSNIRNEILIQVGDFGAGFKSKDLDIENYKRLSEFLCNRNISLYAIRGNHDNPHYFDGQWNFPNVKFLPDYSIFTFEDLKILFIGGAISIDRIYKLEGKDYWKKEEFVLDGKLLSELKGIDVVVTHSAPMFCNPIGVEARIVNDFAAVDITLKKELIKERSELSTAYKILKKNNNIKYWAYGHFHMSNNFTIDGTNFIALNINEFHKI